MSFCLNLQQTCLHCIKLQQRAGDIIWNQSLLPSDQVEELQYEGPAHTQAGGRGLSPTQFGFFCFSLKPKQDSGQQIILKEDPDVFSVSSLLKECAPSADFTLFNGAWK